LALCSNSENIFGITFFGFEFGDAELQGASTASSASATPCAMARLPQTRTMAPWLTQWRTRDASRRSASCT
jgi:hypothetical protein